MEATYLPHEMIENIICRLPVKSLLRFKCVCKQWNATISDPKFTQTHLRLYKNPSSCLLAASPPRVQLVDFQNDEIRPLSAFDYPPLNHESCFLCHCDGLYVTYSCSNIAAGYHYGLWNPSRRCFKKLNQYPFKKIALMCLICYDPSLNDYKVVLGDKDHYAVFYCRRNYWSDLKEMNVDILHFEDEHFTGVSLKGSIYWVCNSSGDKKDGFEIVYFDGRDEELKNLCKIDARTSAREVQLISSGEGLYLLCYDSIKSGILFMKGVGEWMELKAGEVPLLVHGYIWAVLFCSHQNKIIILCNNDHGVIYDVSKTSVARVEYPCDSLRWSGHFYPYIETLFWD